MTSELALRILGIGALAFDPAGAVLALAAITVGARRRGITALSVAYLVAMTAIGIIGTFAVRALAHAAWVRSLIDLVVRHHLVGWGEIATGVGFVAVAAALWIRARRRGEKPPSPPGGGRLARRLTSDLALVGGGVFLAVNMIADPAFTLLAVTVREAPVLWWIPAWVVWAVLSQSLMLVLWVVTLVDREGRLVDRTARAVRAGIARSGGLVRLGLLALGVLALWDGSGRIGA